MRFPSRNSGIGHPGNLQVNLQTIVFPDGSNTPISGFLVHNSIWMKRKIRAKPTLAQAASYYPKATLSSLGAVGRTLSGRIHGDEAGAQNQGFQSSEWKKVRYLAVGLNRSRSVSNMSPPPTGFAPSSLPPGMTSPTVPGRLIQVSLFCPNPRPGSRISIHMELSLDEVVGNPASNPNQIFECLVGPKPGMSMPDPFSCALLL